MSLLSSSQPEWLILETSDWLAINKPAGVSVERTKGASDTMEDQVYGYLSQQKKNPFVGIVHRLDRVTSGVLLMAKKKNALQQLNDQISKRQMTKLYRGLTEHLPPQPEGELVHWLYKDHLQKKAFVFDEPGSDRQECRLKYRVLAEEGKNLLEINLLTGKFHQIRAQLAAIGCPILGDQLYGAAPLPVPHVIALQAAQLSFIDWNSGEIITVQAPAPNW
jgi:23S rRNA pseudouridine1911/1915/1917 synthase